MLLNTWDEARCGPGVSACTLPIFSLIKQWQGGAGVQRDVLVPFFNHLYGDLISFPWEAKTPKALMRAAAQVCVRWNCLGGAFAAIQYLPSTSKV